MTRLRTISLLALPLIALALVAGAVWIFRGEILQRAVRPWAERAAGEALGAEVRIARLAPAEGGVRLTDVSVRRADGTLFAALPEAGIGFTLPGLLDRRLESVLLVRPDLFLAPAGERGEGFSLPAQPPLSVERLSVLGGGIRVRTPAGVFRLHGIEAQAQGIGPIDLRVAAFAGEGRDQPLLLAGELAWEEGLSLTLRTVRWQGTPLLASPLTLRLPPGGEATAEGALRLERLESAQLEAVFVALRKPFPLPAGVRFTLLAPRVDFAWKDEAGLRLQGAFAGGSLRWHGSEVPLAESSWTLERSEQGWEVDLRLAPAEESGGELRGRFAEGGFSGELRLRIPRFDLPRGALAGGRLSGRFRSAEAGIHLTDLRASAHLVGEGVPNGELSASGTGKWISGRWVLELDSLVAEKVSYLSPEGSSGFAGGRLRVAGTLSGEAGGDAVALDLSGEISLEELLRGAFYAELSELPGRWSLRGSWEPEAMLLRADELVLASDGLGRVRLGGRISPATLRTRGSLRLEPLGGMLSERLLPALGEAFPAAKGLGLSGSLEADFAFDAGSRGWRLRGSVRPAGVGLRRGALELRGLAGEIPFDLLSGPVPGTEAKRNGRLTLEAFSLGPAALEQRTLDVAASANRIEIPGAVSFALARGRLRVEDASLARGASGSEFAARIELREIDLAALTDALGWVAMAGRLDADLGRIAYAGRTLSSEGNMLVEVFGGKVLVSGIRLEAPFSDYPLLYGEIDFSGIDLHRLTRTFSFGAIHGIADGFVHDLRLYRFTPSRFEAVLETRESGRRSISVRALENLTVISQGGLSGALSRGIFRFIDFYRYRKIGIWCVLRRDVFVLQGTAREGSERYLVFGGLLPPKIDIIAPEHAISFQEMLKRLRRIERAEGEQD